MKLFDAKPNASNIDFSDILETTSYFVLPPLCVEPPKIVLDLVHLKIAQMHLFIMEIRDRYRENIPVYTDGTRDGNDVACATVFPSDRIISMRLPDSASIFSAEVWANIKALEQIRDSCLQVLKYMKLEHALIGFVIRKCVFLNFCQ